MTKKQRDTNIFFGVFFGILGLLVLSCIICCCCSKGCRECFYLCLCAFCCDYGYKEKTTVVVEEHHEEIHHDVTIDHMNPIVQTEMQPIAGLP